MSSERFDLRRITDRVQVPQTAAEAPQTVQIPAWASQAESPLERDSDFARRHAKVMAEVEKEFGSVQVPIGVHAVTTVGDVKSDARGSGARFNTGKTEYHQIPLFALEGAARVLTYGALKYASGNWLKGQPWTVPFDSALRHLAAWQRGEDMDPESGLAHLDHALCNLIFLAAYRDVYPEGDNRWPQMRKGGVPK